jgi:hypothetical protein
MKKAKKQSKRRQRMDWECTSCKAKGSSSPQGVMASHYLANPRCKNPSIREIAA